MLVLTRQVGEVITIGEVITVTVIRVRRDGRVEVGIDAPREVQIDPHDRHYRKKAHDHVEE